MPRANWDCTGIKQSLGKLNNTPGWCFTAQVTKAVYFMTQLQYFVGSLVITLSQDIHFCITESNFLPVIFTCDIDLPRCCARNQWINYCANATLLGDRCGMEDALYGSILFNVTVNQQVHTCYTVHCYVTEAILRMGVSYFLWCRDCSPSQNSVSSTSWLSWSSDSFSVYTWIIQ